ncbi:carbohydrate-binding family 9-like protein [Sphingobacterium sp. Mn56C]|uniref:carbohydrate-binding family 9-like protein n=1 Tax=Sphingobacterium sp. Mn56C TaxID=3395261 RepID=UPI003BE13960
MKLWLSLAFFGLLGMLRVCCAQVSPKYLELHRMDAVVLEPAAIIALLDEHRVSYNQIEQLNWPNFPYSPVVQFRMAYNREGMLLHFRVHEKTVRALTEYDNGRVYEDSCLEFFVMPDSASTLYYNFEFNAAGRLLAQGGTLHDRRLAAPAVLASVLRWSSLGDRPFPEKTMSTSWDLTAFIPLNALFLHDITDLQGRQFRANFYKCGDKLQQPHYLSWSAINTPKPYFHAPKFFGHLRFL